MNKFLGLDPAQKTAFDKVQSHEKPSQIPVIVTRKSYQDALMHGKMENGVWGCMLTGARMHARMVKRSIYNADRQLTNIAPVAEFFCSGCQKPPTTQSMEAAWETELTTVSM